jgi:hypothetical protein
VLSLGKAAGPTATTDAHALAQSIAMAADTLTVCIGYPPTTTISS